MLPLQSQFVLRRHQAVVIARTERQRGESTYYEKRCELAICSLTFASRPARAVQTIACLRCLPRRVVAIRLEQGLEKRGEAAVAERHDGVDYAIKSTILCFDKVCVCVCACGILFWNSLS